LHFEHELGLVQVEQWPGQAVKT